MTDVAGITESLEPIGEVRRTRVGREATEPMREDIRLLGAMLGDTVREQNGEQVYGLVERKLGDHLLGDPLGHVVGNDIGRDKLLGLIRTIGIQKLNDRLYRFKLNEIAIMHRHPEFPLQ